MDPWWNSFTLDDKLRRLLLAVGYPRNSNVRPMSREKQFDVELLKLASVNKVPLLYLLSIKERSVEVERYLKYYLDRFRGALELMFEISDIFDRRSISYAFFKTVKPFMFTPSDVDLLMESRFDFNKAVMVLRNGGMMMVNRDLLSVTFFNKRRGLFVDLYLEPTVLDLPYLSKADLFKYVTTNDLDGYSFKTLSPSAEVVATAAHAFFKEQMFNLSDFYTLLVYGESVKIHELKALSSANWCSLSLETAFFLTELINRLAFGTHCPAFNIVDSEKCWQLFSAIKFGGKPINMPLKYSFSIILAYLLARLFKEPYFRSTFLKSIGKNASSLKLKKLLEYWKRLSY
jgi:hypothetical protein